jgi:hypothetical protein
VLIAPAVAYLPIKYREPIHAGKAPVYVAPRRAGPTFDVPSLEVTALKRDDSAAWQAIVAHGYSTYGWNPTIGTFAGGGATPFSILKFHYASGISL